MEISEFEASIMKNKVLDEIYFIFSFIPRDGAASPLFLGQAHVIFAGIKIACF